MSTTAIEQARERMNASLKACDDAVQAANAATAEVARLALLEISEREGYESLIGMSFETSYEYDDEGGYFRSATVYPVTREGDITEGVFDDEFSDAMSVFGPEVLCVLCQTESLESTQGEITLEEARERRF